MELFRAFARILNHPLNRKSRFKTLMRVVWWKKNQLFFHVPTIVEIVPGIKCMCYPESSFGSLIVYTRLPEYEEMMFTMNILRSNDVFIDVGAGLGDYSLIAASRIKKGKIFAFEPDVVPLKQLKKNINLNKLQDLIVYSNKIVSDKNGREKFTSEKISELSHISYGKRGKSISSVTLDSFLKNKAKRVRLVKIDVEGAELKVLKGLKEMLKRKAVDYLIVEINHNSSQYQYGSSEIFDLLRKFDYKVYRFGRGKLKVLKKKEELETGVFNILASAKD